jgi:hypothetical protein
MIPSDLIVVSCIFLALGGDAAKILAKRATAVPPVLAELFLAKQRYNLASASAYSNCRSY